LSYLKGVEAYAGSDRYVDEAVVSDRGLLTAGGMSALDFARAIFDTLDIYEPETLEAWYQLNKTGKSAYFAKMAQSAGGR
jgi:hypothetical protein